MLASITVTPGNGLFASRYIPVTNPASPPSKTVASITPSKFFSKRVLRPSAHGIAEGARPKRWRQGMSGILPWPRVPTSRAARLAAARNHHASACYASVSLLFALSAVVDDHVALKPLALSSRIYCFFSTTLFPNMNPNSAMARGWFWFVPLRLKASPGVILLA